ncbi:hypothetical protein M0R19_02555 [Candidatus Pacearchaeota archaeon]|nr:hypothetical protein [Candidatus Pacearchaeota archaeon]
MKRLIFDYYIFIDYSENLLGYMIVDKDKIEQFLPKISRFAHYKTLKCKSKYLQSIKVRIKKDKIKEDLLKLKIRNVRETPEIYADLVEFIHNHGNCLIFISVDNKQYSNFERLVNNVDGCGSTIVRESQLKKDSKEYKMSLVLDTLLNIERLNC